MAKNNKSKHPSLNKLNQVVHDILKVADNALKKGDLDAAEIQYKKAIKHAPNFADAYHNLGIVQMQKNDFKSAIKTLEKAINLNQENPSQYVNLGMCFNALGNFENARVNFARALDKDPNNVQAYNNLGAILLNNHQYKEAIPILNKALELDSNNVYAHNNIGTAYRELEILDQALNHFKKALEIDPKYVLAYNNLGLLLRNLGYYDKAAECFVTAIQLDPNNYKAYSNYSDVLKKQGKIEAAVGALQIAHQINPEDMDVRWNMVLLNLIYGKLDLAWKDYDIGIKIRKRTPDDFGLPMWDGTNIRDSGLVVCREQGIGDEILFANCFSDLEGFCKNVTITCDERLVPIFKRSFPKYKILATKIRNDFYEIDKNEVSSENSYQIPSASLLKYFRPTVDSFPNTKSYLFADKNKVEKWSNRLNAINESPKIGICWKSGLVDIERAAFYLRLNDYAPLFALNGVSFINLQYNDCTDEINNAKSDFGVDIISFDDLDQYNDIDELAAMISSLDLVIGIGTASTALSGALGQKTFRIVDHPVASMLGTDRIPYFPNTTVFMNNINNTEESMSNIASAVKALFNI